MIVQFVLYEKTTPEKEKLLDILLQIMANIMMDPLTEEPWRYLPNFIEK